MADSTRQKAKEKAAQKIIAVALDRAIASEAEASDLRRKLEEASALLSEARHRIDHYADTAAEHDLVARIDALTSGGQDER